MIKKKNLKKLLNLSFTDLTNKTYYCGEYDFSYIKCPDTVNPDYLVLYSEVSNYNKTEKTCLCFYQYDMTFDGINGLFAAIYYNDSKLLKKFKERFKNIKYAIAPDYSQVGDIPKIENLYRLFKARIVALWLCLECNILVIPNITYANESYFDAMLDGMQDSEIVAFSIKGSIKETEQKKLLTKAIKETVDSLRYLKKIVVYSVSGNDDAVYKLFTYASSKGIQIIIPDNSLKERNIILKRRYVNGQNN